MRSTHREGVNTSTYFYDWASICLDSRRHDGILRSGEFINERRAPDYLLANFFNIPIQNSGTTQTQIIGQWGYFYDYAFVQYSGDLQKKRLPIHPKPRVLPGRVASLPEDVQQSFAAQRPFDQSSRLPHVA